MKEKQILLSRDLGYINKEDLSELQRDNKRLNLGTLDPFIPKIGKKPYALMTCY
jgi:hypothetical protein